MAETPLHPSLIQSLRRLFPELNIKIGIAGLKNGQAMVNLPQDFKKPHVFITPMVTTTPANDYGVDRRESYKFKILSSDTSDEADVFWLAIGGQ